MGSSNDPFNLAHLTLSRASDYGWKRAAMKGTRIIKKMLVASGWYSICLTPKGPCKKGYDIPTKFPLCKVFMRLIIKGNIPRTPPFLLWCSFLPSGIFEH